MQLPKPLLLCLIGAVAAAAQSREDLQRDIRQVQRDVAILQDQLRQFDGQMKQLTSLVQQALEAANKGNTSITTLESGLRDRLSQQLTAPITGMSAKVDQMSTEFQSVREAVSDTSERVGKIEAQIVDLSNTIRTLQAPPAPPPPGTDGATTGTTPSGPPSGPPAGLSPKALYESAMRDRSGGNFDLALQGFQEYLKWFGDTELAPNAQFYVGQISYDKNDYPAAIDAFDAVLERFPDNSKTPDAMYMKGMSLLKAGRRTEAGQEFLTVLQKFPRSEVASKAAAMRKSLGLSVPSTAPARRTRR